jgi:hypothetical protein
MYMYFILNRFRDGAISLYSSTVVGKEFGGKPEKKEATRKTYA